MLTSSEPKVSVMNLSFWDLWNLDLSSGGLFLQLLLLPRRHFFHHYHDFFFFFCPLFFSRTSFWCWPQPFKTTHTKKSDTPINLKKRKKNEKQKSSFIVHSGSCSSRMFQCWLSAAAQFLPLPSIWKSRVEWMDRARETKKKRERERGLWSADHDCEE